MYYTVIENNICLVSFLQRPHNLTSDDAGRCAVSIFHRAVFFPRLSILDWRKQTNCYVIRPQRKHLQVEALFVEHKNFTAIKQEFHSNQFNFKKNTEIRKNYRIPNGPNQTTS